MGFIWVDEKEDDQKFKDHLEKKISEATTSLSASNDGLKKDITKLKKKVKDKEGVDVDEFNRLKTENAQLKSNRDHDETEEMKALRIAKEQLEVDNKDLKGRVDILENESKTSMIDLAITNALVGVKVKDSMMSAAEKIIRADVAVVVEDGKRVAKVGDRTIKEHVEHWAKSEEGKNFILADKNKGGGSTGSGGNYTESEGDWDGAFNPESKHFNYTKQGQLKKLDAALYNDLKKKYSKDS